MGGNSIMLKKENLSNLISEDLKSRNENWDVIDKKLTELTTDKEIDFDEVWSYRVPGGEAVLSSSVYAKFSTGEDVVINMSYDWYLYVHSIKTGKLLWRYPFGNRAYGRPQAGDVNGDGKIEVFGASHDGIVYCLSEEGTLIWRHYNLFTREGSGTADSGSEWGLVDSSKDWVKNSFKHDVEERYAMLKITGGTGAGQTARISSAEGSTIWTQTPFEIAPDNTSTYEIEPAFESSRYYQHAGTLNKEGGVWYLYVTGFDNQCVKLNASTGSIVWRYGTLENNEPYPVITDIDNDGNLECIFGSIDGCIHCLDAGTGVVKWKTLLGSGNGVDCFGSSGDVDGDGRVEYITNSRDGRTFYLDGDTGNIKYKSTDWSVWSTSETNSRATIFDYKGQKAVVFGGLAGWMYCLDGTGETIWRQWNGAIIRASAEVFDLNNDGRLEIVVADMMGTVKILDIDGNELTQINMKGSVEGTPLVGDLDGDGNVEIVLCSMDGYIKMFRFKNKQQVQKNQ